MTFFRAPVRVFHTNRTNASHICPRSIIIHLNPTSNYVHGYKTMRVPTLHALLYLYIILCIVRLSRIVSYIVRSFASAAVVLTRRFAYIRTHRIDRVPIIGFSALKARILYLYTRFPENRIAFSGYFFAIVRAKHILTSRYLDISTAGNV